ncbi:MAG: magnesium-translocating P-type ATPase [Actinobacteria bacterium]|nr:magnesium-translocating P-type ATPase [Actinomycetota bacterium]
MDNSELLQGLSDEKAAEYLRIDGPNQISSVNKFSGFQILLRQFLSPAILILLITAVIYGSLGNAHDALILLAIILPSGLLTFIQEYQAEMTMNRLRARLSLTVKTIRNGEEREVPSEELVRGDVVLLKPGDLIPADLILISGDSLSIDEAALTGESFPRRKDAERSDELFMGTHVVSGIAIARVVRTGSRTKYGELAERISGASIETSFEKGLRNFGGLVARAILILVILVFSGNLILHRPIFESLLFSLALAVGLTPQMLPVIISVCLSSGARLLAKKKVLIKRLDAIEDLGTMEILCTDKTGTLTTGELTLEKAIDPKDKENERVALLGFENALLQTSSANSVDDALLRTNLILPKRKKLSEINFSFNRRRVSVLTEDQELITKGAFTEVINLCKRVRVNSAIEDIGPWHTRLLAQNKRWADQGYKVIAVATRSNVETVDENMEREMTFEGILLLNDPPKEDAKDALNKFHSLGINVLLITGDSAVSAGNIAQVVGLDSSQVVTGSEIDQWDDSKLLNVLQNTKIFAEIDPIQKLRIVTALRHSGKVVGFLGDGINDAAALKLSDVSISVEDAVEIAKSASSVVLLEKNLMVIADGVAIGRRTFENTVKYVRITISASFGNVLSMALASFFLPFLPMLPTQILLLNFLSDVPALAISSDRVDPEDLGHSRRWHMKDVGHFMVFFGIISSIFDILVFSVSLSLFDATPEELRSTWFATSLITEVLAIVILRTKRSVLKSLPSRALLVVCIIVTILALTIPGLGILQIFGLPRVGLKYFLLVLVLSTGYGLLTEYAKRSTHLNL